MTSPSDSLRLSHPLRDPQELLAELSLDRLPSTDEIHSEIEERFLAPRKVLKNDWLADFAVHWTSEPPLPPLPLLPSPPTHTPSFLRKGLSGDVVGWTETKAPPPPPSSIQSLLTTRLPAPQTSFVRGKSSNLPFLPGGLEPDTLALNLDEDDDDEEVVGWRGKAPGLKRGLVFEDKDEGEEDDDWVIEAFLGRGKGDEVRRLKEELEGKEAPSSSSSRPAAASKPIEDISGIDDLLPPSSYTASSMPVAKPKRSKKVEKKEWAHVVDVNQELVNFDELVPDMAYSYPFKLDNFQKEAIYHLEMGDSVFVAAHTSAGKTVVAEYAIALAAKHMTRAIYTSPIKALSNQKFRDFKQTFDPSTIGILTGDVQINPEGACLIMTTEILRSMLYKGADLIRDVEFVIFDEVHYVNDAERGVVWEEVIILLPEHVNIILLSATVPNTKEFAGWVGRTKKKDIYVISTPKRPVPLEHFLWAGKELHKILDATGSFLGEGLKSASESLRRKQEKEREAAGLPPLQRTGGRGLPPGRGRGSAPGRGGAPNGRGGTVARGGAPPPFRGRGGGGGGGTFSRPGGGHDKNLWTNLITYLKKANLLPVVCFVFSKKRCEENASSLGGTDLCTASEKSMVHITVERALKRLKGSDKRLPQIQRMRELLSRGIGVHHGGLLPIVKEVVEILFAQGYVKVLFATETFAMGVNMPARSVVFSGTRKHDGTGFRDLLPGEYTQMSGRAGRRGLDPTGVVIIICGDEVPETSILHQMMLGTPNKLSSQFRLTYNMILNLLRVEALRVEEMIKRSFSENASQTLLPEQQARVLEIERSLSLLPKLETSEAYAADINGFYEDSYELAFLNNWIVDAAGASPHGAKNLSSGRVLVLRDNHFTMNLAILLRQAPSIVANASVTSRSYLVLALVDEETKSGSRDADASNPRSPRWPPTVDLLERPQQPTYELRIVPASSICSVTTRIHKLDLEAYRAITEQHRISFMSSAAESLAVVADAFVSAKVVPEADWSKMRALEFQDALKARGQLLRRQKKRTSPASEDFKANYEIVHAEKMLKTKIAELRLAISDQNLELLPDYEQRVEVLRELKFIDENSTVLLKGRVACEINSANELILTELILENILADYSPEEIVALLSCFVFQEKTDVEPDLPPRLQEGKGIILNIAEKIGRVQDRAKVPHDDFAVTLKFGLTEAVYEWAKGMPFEQITELTDVPEGTIVRVITRLDQTCQEVRDAARVIGDAGLFQKMEDAQTKIKRDIVFAASLYF